MMDDMLIGAIKLALTKDSVVNIYLGKTLLISDLRVLGKRVMHIGCGSLRASTIKIVIQS